MIPGVLKQRKGLSTPNSRFSNTLYRRDGPRGQRDPRGSLLQSPYTNNHSVIERNARFNRMRRQNQNLTEEQMQLMEQEAMQEYYKIKGEI